MGSSRALGHGGAALGHGTHNGGVFARLQSVRRTLHVTVLAALVFAAPVLAQPYEVTWYTIDGGGVMFTGNGTYEVGGTIGQTDAGTLSGPSYTVTGGFWAVAMMCPKATTPEHDTLALVGDPVNQKVRYLSFKIAEADAGAQQAVRIHMVDLPAPYDSWNGTKMFVGPPSTFCENAGVVTPPCPEVQPISEFNASTLQCAAEVRDWSAEGVITVFHEGIIPGGQYYVQSVHDDCNLADEASYSVPLDVSMSRWGDVVRSCATWPCTPPDGVVGIPTDVTALLDKFKNLGPPTFNPALRKARADLDWETPNRRIDISDVTFCLDAFRGV
ncbi:MAG: hypothetical protein JSU86_11205, partial [Phycisphaerales bacterium]